MSIRVYGDKGSLEWRQQEPNTLLVKWPDRPAEIVRTGGGYVSAAAAINTRLPMGHAEGYLEAFANIYRAFSAHVRNREEGSELPESALDCPGIGEAIRGMRFIELAVASSASELKWHDFDCAALDGVTRL